MNWTSLTLSALALGFATLSAAAQGPRFGTIKADNVSVMAGTERPDAEIARLDRGAVVEVVSIRGDWAELRLPGGFSVYAMEKVGDRVAIDRKGGPGEGIVVTSGLAIRPRPNRDWPAMGVFQTNVRLEVLREHPGGWLEVVAPRDETVFVASRYVDSTGEQAGLARSFALAASEVESRRAGRVGDAPIAAPAAGERTAAALGADAASKQDEAVELARQARLVELEGQFDSLLAGKPGPEALAALRQRYEEIAREAGPETEVGRAATTRADALRRHERVAASMESVDARIARLENEMGTVDRGYSEELRELREKRKSELSARSGADADARAARFLENGIGQIYRDFGETVADNRGVFMLTKAGERRYRLVSDRYDLGEYRDKTIGITKWTVLEDGANTPWRKVRVERLEVLR
ncbi:MAG: hypothetical protein R3F20_08380 [Planctomycetota bacterium]